jgi:PAT family acetyl-CoA transporter-like MFS transporter 1
MITLKHDFHNFCLLLILYCLQGVPLGLTFGSIPYLLKSRLTYHELAIFSLASYPYSIKLLWSPIVDVVYTPRLGRRKSWIIPIQLLISLVLLYLSRHIDAWLQLTPVPVHSITWLFLLLVTLSATQDIAVDGWALTLLHRDNLTYSSTAQTIGLNMGYFLSFTVFLAMNSPDFCTKYLGWDSAIISLGSYLRFWALAYLFVTALLLFWKEHSIPTNDSILGTYKTIYSILKLPNIKQLLLVLLLAKVGFICNETVTGLKLLELGFTKEDLALAVLIDFPLEIVFGYLAAKWSSGKRPLKPWLRAFYGRWLCSILGMFVVSQFPKSVGKSYFFLVITSTVLTSFMSTIQFVSIGSFFAKISDPAVGGTYMTLLNTMSNLGGTWPKALVLQLVDYFTTSACSIPSPDGKVVSCRDETLRDVCIDNGGVCNTVRDGYYIVNSLSVIIAGILLFFIAPRVKRIESSPEHFWRISKSTTSIL